ncbi:hypothetical protein A1O3_09215 [Capronia epimyces CBS 606.96]|uniref:Uncharacterized protein n=1 Tax=Capronia epimyces CBS 606.96 TaxID=1182542 RepID=W9Y6K2_9EURO|nr:uncharacterized protein A1O3_09215 [Capronia epimyces CBS 606.96]EXJ78054.1 hypothetical protein A1O3_09215 [Capronia epimyces CBS 606.96]
MSQAPTKTSSFHYDDASSSPDPLATSIDDGMVMGSVAATAGTRLSPFKRTGTRVIQAPRRASKTTHHEFGSIPSSPFRAVSEQNTSPWKIRVTVETEHEESEMDNTATRRVTRTVMIPLRQDSSPADKEDGSVRGRRSQTSPSKGKRSGTPVRGGRNGDRARRQSVTDLNVRPLGDDADEDDWLRQKRSPRKRKVSRSRKSVHGGEAMTQSAGQSNVSDFEIRRDTDAESDDGLPHQEHATSDVESAGLRNLDLNRVTVRPRALSTKCEPKGFLDNEGPAALPARKPSEVRKVSVNSAKSYPTPSPSSSPHRDSDDIGNPADHISPGHEGFDTILESEGFTMIDLETLPSAKQYFSSPAEAEVEKLSGSSKEVSWQKQEATAILKSDGDSSRRKEPSVETDMVTYPALDIDDSDISSTVPSSPPVLEQKKSLLQVPSSTASTARKVTPQPYSSPQLPSPPKQDVRRTPHHQHRGSVSALVAGIALQGVVSPKHSSDRVSAREKRTSSPSRDPENAGGLFQGFDSGTQRELRAGLRFGEELARRQSPAQPTAVSPTDPSTTEEHKPSDLGTGTALKAQAKVDNQAGTQVWRGENLVQRTPVQVLASNAIKVTEADKSHPRTPQIAPSTKGDRTLLDTQARREREWQLEREAISRQIQNANESQVIVIDSDSDDEDEALQESRDANAWCDSCAQDNDEEEDIWLAEAKNSSSPGPEADVPARSDENDFFIRTDQIKQRERSGDVLSRPRRSLIPSPWKRGDDIDPPLEQSTFVSTTADDISGLLFYKDGESKIQFGAGEIKRQQLRQRTSSGTFDINLMVGTPTKERVEDETAEESVLEEEDSIDRTDTQAHVDESGLSTQTQEDGKPGQDLSNDSMNPPEPATSTSQPIRIPVNFNNSSNPIPAQPGVCLQPTQLRSPSPGQAVLLSPQRPPTPRSALKGSRQSFPEDLGKEKPDTPNVIRKVVFSERSRGVDIHGLESSFSMRSGSDDSTAGELEWQLYREWQAHDASQSAKACEGEVQTEDETEEHGQHSPNEAKTWVPEDVSTTVRSVPDPAPAKKGWTSWLWGSKATPQPDLESSSSPGQGQDQGQDMDQYLPTIKGISSTARMDGAEDEEDHDDESHQQSQSQSRGWEKTRSSIASSHSTWDSNKRTASTQVRPQASKPANSDKPTRSVTKPPSYLLPPSYPSDPRRAPTSALALSGKFTNTHFRTLHIIYRKSLRPKFHAPARRTIRPEVMALLGMEMEIDETAHGVDGVFTWKVGHAECEVLERFMQECEFSHGVWMGRKVCISSGLDTHNNGDLDSKVKIVLGEQVAVEWGWSVEQLAEWLCRIVVGEVVREEEQTGNDKGNGKDKGMKVR